MHVNRGPCIGVISQPSQMWSMWIFVCSSAKMLNFIWALVRLRFNEDLAVRENCCLEGACGMSDGTHGAGTSGFANLPVSDESAA